MEIIFPSCPLTFGNMCRGRWAPALIRRIYSEKLQREKGCLCEPCSFSKEGGSVRKSPVIVAVLFYLGTLNAHATGPVVCARQGLSMLSPESVSRLCSGASSERSRAPVECYTEALSRFPSLGQSRTVRLCQGATSLSPLTCYAEGLESLGSFGMDQLILLCVARGARGG